MTIENETDDLIIPADAIQGAFTNPENAGGAEEQEDIEAGSDNEDDTESESEEETTEEEKEEESDEESEESGDKTEEPIDDNTKEGLTREIVRLRKALRQKSVKDITENAEQDLPDVSEKIQKLRDMGYTDDQIGQLDTVFDVFAEKKGYVKKATTYQDVLNEELNTFIDANKEYSPKIDKDDVRWNKFQEVLASGLFDYKTPKSREKVQALLKKVHNEVVSELGSPTERNKEIAAQQQKIRSVSHSGGTKVSSTDKKVTLTPEMQKVFKGFTDDDFN